MLTLLEVKTALLGLKPTWALLTSGESGDPKDLPKLSPATVVKIRFNKDSLPSLNQDLPEVLYRFFRFIGTKYGYVFNFTADEPISPLNVTLPTLYTLDPKKWELIIPPQQWGDISIDLNESLTLSPLLVRPKDPTYHCSIRPQPANYGPQSQAAAWWSNEPCIYRDLAVKRYIVPANLALKQIIPAGKTPVLGYFISELLSREAVPEQIENPNIYTPENLAQLKTWQEQGVLYRVSELTGGNAVFYQAVCQMPECINENRTRTGPLDIKPSMSFINLTTKEILRSNSFWCALFRQRPDLGPLFLEVRNPSIMHALEQATALQSFAKE
jgi:hypothetical protein